MSYVIGDTIRLEAIIKDFLGEEEEPGSISLSVYKEDGTQLLKDATPEKKDGTIAQYFYDFLIPTSLSATQSLVAVWSWSGAHKKVIRFKVKPIVK